MIALKVRNIVNPKEVCGEVLITTKSISYLGELEPERGYVKGLGRIDRKILIYSGGVGSTVGSYVVYGLSINGKKPYAIIIKSLDIVTLVGAILAEIPLYVVVDGWNNIVKLVSSRNFITTWGCLKGGVLIIEEFREGQANSF